MPRRAFIRFVDVDQHDEYERRHDEIWPELEVVFAAYGVRRHSAFLQEETHQLFAYVEYDSEEQMSAIAQTPVVQRRWR